MVGKDQDHDERVRKTAYSMPPSEVEIPNKQRLRAAGLGQIFNRSEIVRAAILALEAMSDEEFLIALERLPRNKPGPKP